MRYVRTTAAVLGASALMILAALPGSASATEGTDEEKDSYAEVLLTDLSSPKGLAVTPQRDLAIGQGALADPSGAGPVLIYNRHGSAAGTVTPITEPANLIDIAVSPTDGTGWAIVGDGSLVHQLNDGTIVPVANIPAYQAGDPDPVDQESTPTDSNPYGLAIAPNGDALVADAAGNDLLRFTPEGVGSTMARFDVETLSTDQAGDPTLPPTIDAEAVPTTVTVGPDGAFYVGELKGFPFRVGSSHIWRIKPDADGAWCSTNAPDPTHSCRVYASGYTAIQDIVFNKNNHRLYVYELAADGVLAFEAGFAPGGVFPPAVLLEVTRKGSHEHRTELAAGQLSQPGGVVVAGGHVYVTDGIITGGRLLAVHHG
ncbi:MAG: hypothetical protein QOE09_3490 [Ilumatobacteraceae bacterium]